MTPSRRTPSEGSTGTSGASDRSARKGNVGRWERAASAALGGALLTAGLRRRSLGGAASAFAGCWLLYRGIIGLGRVSDAVDRSRESGASDEALELERSVTVGRPADELARFWRDPEQLSRIVGSFADVSSAGEDRHRWTVPGPLGRSLSWETRIVEDRPGELLRWESEDGAVVSNEVSVRFRPAPGDRGTAVSLRISYEPPGGAFGDAAMDRLGIVPESLAGAALDRFKSLAETGEIPTTEANPSARGKGDLV